MSLNDRDAAVYELIRQRAGEGYTPSIREICRELGIKSTSTVHRILGKLQDEGLIERLGENLNRSFRLAGDGSNIRERSRRVSRLPQFRTSRATSVSRLPSITTASFLPLGSGETR